MVLAPSVQQGQGTRPRDRSSCSQPQRGVFLCLTISASALLFKAQPQMCQNPRDASGLVPPPLICLAPPPLMCLAPPPLMCLAPPSVICIAPGSCTTEPVAAEMRAGGSMENPEGERRRSPKMKNPAKIWKNCRQQNHTNNTERVLEQEVLEQQEEEQLEEVSRKLILREEQLFSQDPPSEEEEDRLQIDLEALSLQMWMAVQNIFSTSSGNLKVLRSAVVSIRQQEDQDRRWTGCPGDRIPVWRPQKCLRTHNTLLHHMVESRLKKAAEDHCRETPGLSSPLKRQVCRMGRCVKEDLLTVVRTVQDCYLPQMDILNCFAGLFHQNFSARLTELAGSGLEPDDCSYLLFWINRCYPQDVLNHEDLQGRIKTACLGSLLPLNQLDRLEDQYLTHKEDKVKLWLKAALKKEEESWLSGQNPELIEQFCFSPLAIDVIQVMNGSLTDFSCVIRDQSEAQRITAHLDSFLRSYLSSVQQFVKGHHGNAASVIKAQLVCEQQLRDYITSQTGSLSERQRRRCLDTLSALKDCGYRCFTCPIHTQLKVCLRQLWTPVWLDGSLPVVDSLLDFLNHQLMLLNDLHPDCRQYLLSLLHQDLVLQYVKRMMKSRMKSREQQVGGAQRMNDDAQKITDFFREGGCSGSRWLGEVLCSLAEVLRLQDPASVQLELVSLARTFPDLSDAHVSALLSLRTGLSAADVRSIRRSVEENRLLAAAATNERPPFFSTNERPPFFSTNERPPFFSRVKVQWIHQQMQQLKAL